MRYKRILQTAVNNKAASRRIKTLTLLTIASFFLVSIIFAGTIKAAVSIPEFYRVLDVDTSGFGATFAGNTSVLLSPDNSEMYVINIYKTDSLYGRIMVYDTAGLTLKRSASLNDMSVDPEGGGRAAISPDGSKIYVAFKSLPIYVFDAQTLNIVHQFGEYGSASGEFMGVTGIVFAPDGARYYILDSQNHRVQIFNSADDSYVGQFGSVGTGDGQFGTITSAAITPDGTKILISDGLDTNSARIQIFNTSTYAFESMIDLTLSGLGSFVPYALAISPDGSKLYVADPFNGYVHIFDADNGSYIGKFGTPGTGAEELNLPTALSISSNGNNLLVASQGNTYIQEFRYEPQVGGSGTDVVDNRGNTGQNALESNDKLPDAGGDLILSTGISSALIIAVIATGKAGRAGRYIVYRLYGR